MYKVVINSCYGGFGLSEEASDLLYSKYPDMLEVYKGYNREEIKYLKHEIERHDKRLIEVIEELGVEKSSGDYAKLYIEEIETPMYRITEYDGFEDIETPSSLDWIVIKE